MRFAFAGDRDVAVAVLAYLRNEGHDPVAVLLPEPHRASHAEQLLVLAPGVPEERILRGDAFRTEAGMRLLDELDLDLIVAVHFAYVVPAEILRIPRQGVVNLHPAYLPYNRGWHTPTWCILEGTPAGATLHFMDEEIDSGDIIHQQTLDVGPADTAHTLYLRLKELELRVFQEAWPRLLAGDYERRPQDPVAGTQHRRADLFSDDVQRLDLKETTTAEELLRKLRALTTDRPEEAAFFEVDGRRYRVRIDITEEGK